METGFDINRKLIFAFTMQSYPGKIEKCDKEGRIKRQDILGIRGKKCRPHSKIWK